MAVDPNNPYKPLPARNISLKGIPQAGASTSPLLALAAARASALGQQVGGVAPGGSLKTVSTKAPSVSRPKGVPTQKPISLSGAPKRTAVPKASALGAAPKHLATLLGMAVKQAKSATVKAPAMVKAKSVSVKRITANSV